MKITDTVLALCLKAGTAALVIAAVTSGCGGGQSGTTLNKVQLGKALFSATNLSQPAGQSCATCHQPASAFTDARPDSLTSQGAVMGRFGKRQTPTIAYMAFSPKFHFDAGEQDYVGGQFWDGRAADLKDQVHFPLLGAAEMNNASKADVVAAVRSSSLGNTLRAVYGTKVFDTTDTAFDAIADAIATFEASPEVNPFSSKYDFVLKGKATLTADEAQGLALFKGKAKCANCHPCDPHPDGSPPLLTDYTYDNIGLPRNDKIHFFSQSPSINPDGALFKDVGLMQTTGRPEDAGRMKVPTLRNIALTAPYFHNGDVATLEQAVQFYNKRDLGFLPGAEFPGTMNMEELGNLQLTDEEVKDIVAFMKTLTDGYVP